ncbi:hypothetical protein HOE37_03650 [Candidatus Woesearchaeota archaeon]|nr:hypothetical protein [Candidatus Woesearchaeota archaeon]MBT4110925.1 hypothetical protein [Candidatus Woesearchaeota archaeon]MBT4336563.1 hypothetical protein [Candidatus Woesearchaeota archaeon]MBT4469688.1 hypothetical protein [Candidatus Woesearchaeota archaeon]MBT6744050.1 hypothetical protein [Candidatus Woesearchaeota archaeon]
MVANASPNKTLDEEVIRSSVADTYSDFERFEIVNRWGSSHANLYRVHLINPTSTNDDIQAEETESVVIKVFLPVHTGDHYYDLAHQPGVTHPKEVEVLDTLPNIFRNLGADMLPNLVGTHYCAHPALSTSDLGSLNLKRAVREAAKNKGEFPNAVEEVFKYGLDAVAKFAGFCGHIKDQMVSEHPRMITKDRRVDEYLFTEHLSRIYFNVNKDCRRQGDGRYDSENVRKHIQERFGIDLRERVSEIMDLRECSGLFVEALQHGDCNSLNLVSDSDTINKIISGEIDVDKDSGSDLNFVDFVDFGMSSDTRDIASYCVLVGVSGLGSNPISDSPNLGFYLHRYHALTHAWARQDPDLADHIKILKNGALKEFVQYNVLEGNKSEYCRRHFSVLTDQIDKIIQLAASFNRYDPVADTRHRGTRFAPEMLRVSGGLFRTVGGTIDWTESLDQTAAVRQSFYALGNLLKELKLYSPQRGGDIVLGYALDQINGNTPTAHITRESPFHGPEE